MFRNSLAIALVAGSLSVTIAAGPASATVLERIKAAGKVVLGYRDGAAPFSYKDAQGQPVGYTIDICQAVADDLKAALGVSDLPVEWVPVPIENGLTPVAEGKVDLLCGAAETLARRKRFPSPFRSSRVAPASWCAQTPRSNCARCSTASRPARSGVAHRRACWTRRPSQWSRGTTSEDLLRNTLTRLQITANVAEVESYQAGVVAVLDRSADVLVGDRSILVEASQSSTQPADLLVIDRTFDSEPVALPLDRNDADFRLAVDHALSKLYRSDRFRDIYRKWFGDPDEATESFFRNAALPD